MSNCISVLTCATPNTSSGLQTLLSSGCPDQKPGVILTSFSHAPHPQVLPALPSPSSEPNYASPPVLLSCRPSHHHCWPGLSHLSPKWSNTPLTLACLQLIPTQQTDLLLESVLSLFLSQPSSGLCHQCKRHPLPVSP
jgi:hypothetical protein